jgi:hypothetical protein
MRHLRTAMVAAALTVAFVVPSTASAQLNKAEIGPSAQRAEDGLLVLVPVIISCDAGLTGVVSIRVAQSTGNRLNVGFNGAGFECTGSDQTVIVTIPTSSTIPWKAGKATATGFLFLSSGLQTDLGPQEIHIRK